MTEELLFPQYRIALVSLLPGDETIGRNRSVAIERAVPHKEPEGAEGVEETFRGRGFKTERRCNLFGPFARRLENAEEVRFDGGEKEQRKPVAACKVFEMLGARALAGRG